MSKHRLGFSSGICQRKLVIFVDHKFNMSQLCDSDAKKANEKKIFQSILPWSDITCSIVSNSGYSSLKRILTNWNKFKRELPKW